MSRISLRGGDFYVKSTHFESLLNPDSLIYACGRIYRSFVCVGAFRPTSAVLSGRHGYKTILSRRIISRPFPLFGFKWYYLSIVPRPAHSAPLHISSRQGGTANGGGLLAFSERNPPYAFLRSVCLLIRFCFYFRSLFVARLSSFVFWFVVFRLFGVRPPRRCLINIKTDISYFQIFQAFFFESPFFRALSGTLARGELISD